MKIKELDKKYLFGETIRLRLLAALLRLADALDQTRDRVNLELLKQWDIPLESKIHWYTHYYVQSVDIDEKGRIRVYLGLNSEYKGNNKILNYFKKQIRETIRKHLKEVHDILWDYELKLYMREDSPEIELDYYESIEPLPDELVEYIEKNTTDTEKFDTNKSNMNKHKRNIDDTGKKEQLREFEEKQLKHILENKELNHIPHIFGEGEGLPIEEYYVKLRLVNRPEKRRRELREEGRKDNERERKDLQDIVKLPDEIIEECLKEKHNRVLVFGEPGSGKTTLSKYLTRCVLMRYVDESKLRCVFYAKLRDYDGDLRKLVFGEYSDAVESLNPDYAVVLDGLDEVRPELVKKAVEEINDIPFFTVVTTRPTTDAPLAGDQVYEICPLSPEDVRVMSEKWLRYLGLEDVDGFLGWLRERNLMSLASNPLLLYMLCYIYCEGGRGAGIRGRVDVYDEIVKYSKKHIKKKRLKKTSREINEIWKDSIRVCGRIAYETITKNVTVDEDYLIEILDGESEIIRDTEDFVSCCPFIVLSGNTVQFVHETFKEYFAASHLSKKGWKEWLGSVLNEERLLEVKEVVKMLCAILYGNGRDEDVEELLRTIYDSSVDTVVKYPVICECIGEMGLSLCEQGFIEGFDEEYYIELNLFGLEWGIWAASDPFFDALVEARDVEFLVRLLKDRNDNIRKAAAWALGEIGDSRAVEPLIEALGNENDGVRWAAAEALGKIGDSRAVEPLIERLKDKDDDVRKAAAEALGKIGDSRAVEPLIERLKDKDDDVRWAAARALGKIGEPAVEPLIEILVRVKYVRWTTARALNYIALKSLGNLITVRNALKRFIGYI